MKWTPEMIAAVKGNAVPYGILLANGLNHAIWLHHGYWEVWHLLKLAHQEGAPIEYWHGGKAMWRPVESVVPGWGGGTSYRVASDWEPKPEEPPTEKKPITLTRLHFENGQAYEISETYSSDGRVQKSFMRRLGTIDAVMGVTP